METDKKDQTSHLQNAYAMLGGENATIEYTPDPNAGNIQIDETDETVETPAKADVVPEAKPEIKEDKSKDETAGQAEPEIDYKTKFSASTREAQRLAAELKLAEARIAEKEAAASVLAKEKEEMERRFADQNPEAYDQIKTSKEMATIKEKLLLQEERIALEDFTKGNPEAVEHKDALKKLGRAFPGKTYEDIWNETFAPFYEKQEVKAAEDKEKSMPETGAGSVSEVSEDLTLAEINKLPLAKRKAYFKKAGIAV